MNQPIKDLPPLNIEGAEFVYRRNFTGAAVGFDEEGDRNFNVKIDPAIANALEADGWNIKWTKPGKNASEEVVRDFVPEPFLNVAVGFKFRPPTIFLIRNGQGTVITEKTVATLDSAEFTNVDMVIRGRRHEMQGGGYKAWLAEFYGTVEVSEIGSKYLHLLDSAKPADEEDPDL